MMRESHLRRLSITMRALEDALLAVEAALSATPNLLMTVYEDDLPQTARPAIREHIQLLREEIRVVKDRYGLRSETISNRRRLLAKLTFLSIDLTELTSRYLRAYGDVPRDEQGDLDDQITKMIALVDNMQKLV
jgi:hypothetical protein